MDFKVSSVLRGVLGGCGALILLLFFASSQAQSTKWVASWAAPMQGTYSAPSAPQGPAVPAYDPQPDLSFALPSATAANQTFRMIVKPDLWGRTARIRLSNVFGTQPVIFSAAAVALQDYQANIVPGTSVVVRFAGATSIQVPAGASVFSDPITLAFVEPNDPGRMSGRNLAVSFAVSGTASTLTFHKDAFTTSYISPRNSGNVTAAQDDTAFPYTTTSWFFLSEVDVMAPADTRVIVAFGDSITDGTFSTLNGNDRWLDVMSRKLHQQYGSKVSVVNAGISGNAVLAPLVGPAAIERVNRDVIQLSGASIVVWMQGINDLGITLATAPQVIAGYRQVVDTLHAAGLKVVGGTLTPSLAPGGVPPQNSPLVAAAGPFAVVYASILTDLTRKQINTFIRTSRIYDGVVDFAAAVTDPATGTLRAEYVPNSEGSAGDYLHPNRAGYQAMGAAAAAAVLSLP